MSKEKTIEMLLLFKVDKQPYELPLIRDVSYGLTPREHGRIKALASGAAGVDIPTGAMKGDYEIYTALAIVAMERAGVTVDVDAILDGKSKLEIDVKVPSEDPPTEAGGGAAQTSPDITPDSP